MKAKKFLAVIIILLFTVVFSPERSGIESHSVAKVFSSLKSEITVTDHTYVYVLINDELWIRVYDDKGSMIEEYPAE